MFKQKTGARFYNGEYRRLLRHQYLGWGGAKFPDRMTGWREGLTHFQSFPEFPLPPGRVLEVGCGNALVAKQFSAQGYSVKGLDISKVAIEWARKEFKRLQLQGTFSVGDVCCIEEPDNNFNLVVDGNCFHYVVGDDRRKAFKEVHRVLLPGGYFLLSSMCGPLKLVDGQLEHDTRTNLLRVPSHPLRYLPSFEMLISEMTENSLIPIHMQLNDHQWWNHLWVLAKKEEECSSVSR